MTFHQNAILIIVFVVPTIALLFWGIEKLLRKD